MIVSTAQQGYCTETTMRVWQPPTGEASALSVATTEHLWCEILPITLNAGEIVYIQRGQDTAAAWHERYDGGGHPSAVVRARVEGFFGSTLDPRGC